MSDDLVKRLRDLGDHAAFEPHMHHTAADRIEELEAKLAICEKYKAAYAECDRIGTQAVCDLEAKLNKAIGALEKVQAFVRDLEPHADQGHTLVPVLREACETLVELKQGA